MATLDSADLGMISGARWLYVDWYDGDHIIRPMDRAVELGVPVFLNLEHGHQDASVLEHFVSRATICQAVPAPGQEDRDPLLVARTILAAGAETTLVTLAGQGCLAVSGNSVVRATAPEVTVKDGCSAGATFSAAFLYGKLKGWDLESTTRLATAAASLKCTVVGPRAFPWAEIGRLAKEIKVVRSALTPE